jgi:hypothetical protein
MKTPEQERSEQPAETTPASAPGARPQVRSEALEAELAALEALLVPEPPAAPSGPKPEAAPDKPAPGAP